MFIVAYHPDPSLTVAAVGPFRSREKADLAAEEIAALDDTDQIARAPQVVEIQSLAQVAKNGEPDE